MDLLTEYAPELIVACTVFVVLSAFSYLYSNVKIFRWIVTFMLFRALVPLIGTAAMYYTFYKGH